ncbi:hypothetical protein AMTR_s00126p00069040 [Amborella trichopoda]|uniref:Uncharacterized protein n=1 Tax=Amborella trichopoda TaxID=13333 RepID=W1NNA6_AMBTC|nr:hypothetical protein AMTR_s00126p00069040 [Amborella trichopoda]
MRLELVVPLENVCGEVSCPASSCGRRCCLAPKPQPNMKELARPAHVMTLETKKRPTEPVR